MTLAEKVAMMHGAEDPLTAQRSPDQRGAGYVVGVPRLGVPPLRLTDGPAGIRTARPATALPAPIALGASFDPELALRFGAVLGGEARAANQDVVLAPMVDIVRTPLAGRAFETLGEDPFLAARLAEAEISGIQSAGAIAAVKHLAANNQEDHRSAIDVHVDERTLREIYLPPFAAAIRAGAGAVMCGYYAVNGVPACQNQMLLDRYLRGELGFTGWVISDWGATHSTLPSLLAGLDMEMWSGARYGVLADMVPQYVPEALVDAAVRRILGTMDRAGLLREGRPRPIPDWVAHRALAREIAIGGTVLLRNTGETLPLTRDGLQSLVLIGPAASTPVTGGGGSSRVAAPDARSLLHALRARAWPGVPAYSVGIERDGVPVPAAALEPTDNSVSTIDLEIPANSEWHWSGGLNAPRSGRYTLALQASPIGEDPAAPWRAGGIASLSVEGTEVVALGGSFGGDASLLPTADGLANATSDLDLRTGSPRWIGIKARAGSQADAAASRLDHTRGAGERRLPRRWLQPGRLGPPLSWHGTRRAKGATAGRWISHGSRTG